MNSRHQFDSLTGLKGLFCLVIVFFHTLPTSQLVDSIPFTSLIRNYGGMIGNCFFFICSGFLIACGYKGRIESRSISFREFLIKRLCKLYPLYLLTNLVSLIINTVTFGPSAINLQRIVFTVLLQNGGGLGVESPYNGPSWFISALFVCYLIFYFIAYYSRSSTQYWCLNTFCVIWGYSILTGKLTAPLAFAHHGFSIFCFFIGTILANIYPLVCKQDRRWFRLAALILLLGSGYLMMRYGVEVIAGDSQVAFACLIIPLMIYLALHSKPVAWFLTSRPIQHLGKVSFSIYLWHFVVYDFFRYSYQFITHTDSMTVEGVWYLAYLALNFAISFLSVRFLEPWLSRVVENGIFRPVVQEL